MKQVLVIQENDRIIGVASTTEKAIEMMGDYFGINCNIYDINDIRDSGLEFTCKVTDTFDKIESNVTVYYFTIDEV